MEKSEHHSLDLVPVEIVTLNARGVKFEMPLTHMDHLPNSRLANLKAMIIQYKLNSLTPQRVHDFSLWCDFYDPVNNEFYFNKDPDVVACVLDFYETQFDKAGDKQIHIDTGSICVLDFQDEMENYWLIYPFKEYLEPCCLIGLENEIERLSDKIAEHAKILDEYYYRDEYGQCCFPRLREKIWDLMENPSSSIYAKVAFKQNNII
jgi:hypothetical protein